MPERVPGPQRTGRQGERAGGPRPEDRGPVRLGREPRARSPRRPRATEGRPASHSHRGGGRVGAAGGGGSAVARPPGLTAGGRCAGLASATACGEHGVWPGSACPVLRLSPAASPSQVEKLYLRCLRAESFRKALVYQKKYLLLLIGGFQDSEQETLSMIAHLGVFPSQADKATLPRPFTKFRTAVRVVIAISRYREAPPRGWGARAPGPRRRVRRPVGRSGETEET